MRNNLKYAALALVLGASYAHAEDNNDKIFIQSDKAKYEQLTGIATYEGKVVLTQTDNTLNADKLSISKSKNGAFEKITAVGSPATFYGFVPEEKKPVTAKANTIYYFPQQSQLKLVGKAKIDFENDSFTGPVLEYDANQHTIIAVREQNERPTITLQAKKLSQYEPKLPRS